jgi:hypothetical protein
MDRVPLSPSKTESCFFSTMPHNVSWHSSSWNWHQWTAKWTLWIMNHNALSYHYRPWNYPVERDNILPSLKWGWHSNAKLSAAHLHLYSDKWPWSIQKSFDVSRGEFPVDLLSSHSTHRNHPSWANTAHTTKTLPETGSQCTLHHSPGT